MEPSVPQNPPDFLFVTCDPQADKETKRSLRAVRKHVMRDYFRRQQGKDPRRHRKHVAPQSQVDGQIEGSDQYFSGPPTPSSSEDREADAMIERSVRAPQGKDVAATVEVRPSSDPSISGWTTSQQTNQQDMPPIRGKVIEHATSDQNELLSWYRCRDLDPSNWELGVAWLQIYDKIYTQDLWNAAMTDEGIFFTVLCIGYARRVKVTGRYDRSMLPSQEIRMTRYIRERLSDPEGVDDSLMMLISCLVRIHLAEGEHVAANTHMRAVQKLFQYLGVSSFRDIQRRCVVWTDIRLASTLLQAPFLTYCPERRDPQSLLSTCLLREADDSTEKTMAMMPAALTGDEAKTQMHGLHMAGLAYTSREHVVEPHKDALWTIQDLHYQYIYRLCVLVAEGTKHPFSAAQAILLTMRLYAWTCVPEFIPEQVRVKVNYGPLMKRVSERGLNRLHKGLRRWPDLIEWWTTESQTKLECLLWVLFVAWSLSRIECKNQIFEPMPPFHGVDFFETKLRQVVKALGLERKEAIEKTLKVFPWVDHFSAENCEELWMRIN